MSGTANLNEKTVHLDSAPNESGKHSGKDLVELQSRLYSLDLEGPGEQAAPISENHSKSPSINVATTPVDEKSEPSSAAVPVVKGKQSDDTIENLVALFRDFLEAAPNPAPSESAHTTQRHTVGRKRFFGLTKLGSSPESSSNNPYDYEQKYPRDRFGEETADNARVWLTYLDEAEAFDRERVEGWKETADVLLVFAGLFSGVITTFVSQASQSLQQDNTLVSASLLSEIAQILRAQSIGTPINIIPNSTLTPTSPFTPSTNAFLVNGLWFTSLAITLSTALFAVLAKQWLYYYLSSIPGTANEKARARQLRFKGFELWKVGAIVDLLPILLHLAVGVFLTGIIILLFPLDIRVAWTIVVITGITYTLYFISVILPIRYPECPYTTSLTIYVGILFFLLRESLRWISAILDNGFQAVWRRINFEIERTILRLLHYAQGLFRHTSMSISKLVGLIGYGCRKLRPTIFTEEFPKFTNWREENIKKAVKNAAFLDFEALNWLYTTSPNRSVHRIIARGVAVHPIINQRFRFNICDDLWLTLEVSETNIVDFRHGLCLDLLAMEHKHWRLLRSIPDVVESQLEEEEYRSYSQIAENVLARDYGHVMQDAINNDLKFPLTMWCFFLQEMPRNITITADILIYEQTGLFKWKYNPTREIIRNASVVSLDSEELGWWKFDYLYRYFLPDSPDYSSETKSSETCYRLLITIYRNLTTDQPLIADQEQRQESLLDLFLNFRVWLHSLDQDFPFEDFLASFKDICCADAFWSESMTDDVRLTAVACLDWMWGLRHSMDTAKAKHFTDYNDLSLLYQLYSRDLHPDLSRQTPPVFRLLFAPQNRQHLCTILLNDPNAVSHFTKCLQNLGDHYVFHKAKRYMFSSLMDLFASVMDPKMPLFTVLYNSSVLLRVWKLLVFCKLDAKRFFFIVKPKLGLEKLNELYVTMTEQARSNDWEVSDSRAWELGYDGGADIPDALEASAREFGQIMGVSHVRLQLATEQSALQAEGAANRDHDIEERAQVPGPSERESSHSINNWTKKVLGSVWPKTSVK